MASLAQINVLFRADLDQFSSEMQNAQRELQKTGKKMQEMGAQMSTYLTAPLVAIGAFSSKISMDFDDSMRKVMATTNATGEEFKAMTATAEEMGAKTRYTASQAAEAMNYMALAGWKSQQIISGIPGVLALASASGEDLGMVADILTDGLTAMGKGAEQASQFVDVLAASASNSNTTVGMMGQAFQYAAPLAGAFGYEVEDLALAIGLMANAGIKGEKAGTALRSLMTRMVKPTREAQKAMTDLGIEVKNADGSMKPLGDVIDQIRTKFGKLTDAQKGQYAGMLAGQEAISGLLAIVNAAPADFDKLTKSIVNSAGTAERMQNQMEGGIGGAWREMSSAVEGVAIQIGKVLEPAFRSITVLVKDLSKWFLELSDTAKTVIVVVGGVVAAIGPVLLALGMLVKILPVLAAGWSAMTVAINTASAAMVANPIGAMIIAVTALSSALLLMANGADNLTNSQSNLNDINSQVIKNTGKQIAELERLIKVAKDVKETDNNRIEAVKNINAMAPEYLGNITKETINTNTATVAVNKYVEALKNKARQQAIVDKQGVLYAKLLERESEAVLSLGGAFGREEIIIRNREEFDKYVKSIGASGAQLTMLESKFKVVNDQRQKDISSIKDQITYMDKLTDSARKEAVNIEVGVQSDYAKKELLNLYEDFKNTDHPPLEVSFDLILNNDKGDKFLKNSVAFYEAQIKGLEEMRSNTALSLDEYGRYAEAIDAVQKKIDALQGKREKATAITMNVEPVPEGSIASYERLIAQKREDIKVMEIGSLHYKALASEIKDLEFTLKTKVDEESFSAADESMRNLQASIEGQSKAASDMLIQRQEEAVMYGEIVGGAFDQLSQNFLGSMGEAENGLARFGQAMAGTVLKIISMALANAMANSIVGATQSGNATGPGAVFATPAFIATSIAGILGAFASIPKFADGGIVSGPTFGLMGEYAGAANNPEVIAPLNKLKDLIEPANAGGSMHVTVGGGFEIDGTKLRLVLDRTATRGKRIG